MRIGITGASGFLGSVLREKANSRGHVAIPLTLPRDSSLRDRAWQETWLNPESIDLLIHGAASVKPVTDCDLYLNTHYPRALESFYHEKNPNGSFIHISSINVVVEALVEPYSTSKREAETLLNLDKTLVVRPSLIWSTPDRGPARRLRDFLLKLPVSVMTFPGNRHCPVRVQDLAETILNLGESGRKNGVFNVHGDKSYTLWEIAKDLAKKERRPLLPIPAPCTNKRLPKILRSIDYTNLSKTWKPFADETFVLPFRL